MKIIFKGDTEKYQEKELIKFFSDIWTLFIKKRNISTLETVNILLETMWKKGPINYYNAPSQKDSFHSDVRDAHGLF